MSSIAFVVWVNVCVVLFCFCCVFMGSEASLPESVLSSHPVSL